LLAGACLLYGFWSVYGYVGLHGRAQELERQLKSERLTDEELHRTKDYLKGSTLLGLESTTSRMANLARQEMYFGRHIAMDEIAREVEAVTAEDVLGVAQDLLEPSRIALTVLGPLNGNRITRAELAC